MLAIAGLVLAIVFIAVPALQRNSRDTQRRADVSAIQSGIATFIGNNNGQIPDSAADLNQALDGLDLGFYNSTAAGVLNATPATGAQTSGQAIGILGASAINATTPAAVTGADNALVDAVNYFHGASCDSTAITKATGIAAGNTAGGWLNTAGVMNDGLSRGYAIVYAVESDPNILCIDNAG